MRMRDIKEGKTYVNYRGDRRRKVQSIFHGKTHLIVSETGLSPYLMKLRTFAAWACEEVK